MRFDELSLKPEILAAIDSMGYEEATPIQAQAIPAILEGRDLIGCAQTGTGKTAAYLLPTLNKLLGTEGSAPRVLIIVPTRELAEQIDQNVDGLAYFTSVSSVAVYGGRDSGNWDKQKYALLRGADILIATPGRLLSHISLGYVNFNEIHTVILDEADKMLDMGFHGDILRIISQVPNPRQTLMFSATMPPRIRKLAKEIMQQEGEPVEINLNLARPAAGIVQSCYFVTDDKKIPLLEHLLRTREVESMIIFASSKISVDRIEQKLLRLNLPVRAIHSDREQEERSATLRDFRNRQFKILVGTDVLARGIDIDNLSHVLNYDAPPDADDYVHRVGRTARASATGEAISFVNGRDMYKWRAIEQLIGYEVPRGAWPEEELGPQPDVKEEKGRGGDRGGRGGDRGRSSDRSRGGERERSYPPRERRPEGAAPGPEGQADPAKRKKRKKKPAGTGPGPTGNGSPQPPAEGEARKKKKKKRRNRPPRSPGSPEPSAPAPEAS